jgi:hypothetical protein
MKRISVVMLWEDSSKQRKIKVASSFHLIFFFKRRLTKEPTREVSIKPWIRFIFVYGKVVAKDRRRKICKQWNNSLMKNQRELQRWVAVILLRYHKFVDCRAI